MRKVFGVKENLPQEDIATRTKNNMETVRDLFQDGLGIAQWRGTAWAAFNAMTEYSDHHRALKGDTDLMESKILGSGAAFKHKALTSIESVIAAA